MPLPYPGDDYVNERAPAHTYHEAIVARYAANDWAKRHRLPDHKAKTVQVEPHVRRAPN